MHSSRQTTDRDWPRATRVSAPDTPNENAEPQAEKTPLSLRVLQVTMGEPGAGGGGVNRYVAGLLGPGDVGGGDARVLAGESGGEAGALRRLWRVRRTARVGVRCVDLVAAHFALYAWPVLGMLRDTPLVVHFHGPWAEESRREGEGRLACAAKASLERRVYTRAARVIALSRSFARMVVQRYQVDEGNVVVVPGGVDADRFDVPLTRAEARSRLNWPGDRPIVLAVRRLTARMGLEALVDAAVRLRACRPDVLVVIAGRGPLQQALERRVAERGLAAHVRLVGFVPEEDLPAAYRAADVTVVPSESLEGFGLTTLESLAAGTPVVATPVGGLPEVVGPLHEGLLASGTDAEAIAEALGRVLDGQLRPIDPQTCRAYARRFDWSQIAPRVGAVYRQAIGA